MTSSEWDSNECSLRERLRRSQRATVLSPEPVRRRLGDEGEKATALTSAEWASIACLGLSEPSSRVSQLQTTLKRRGRQSASRQKAEEGEKRTS